MNHPLAWDGGPGDSHGASYLGGIKPSVQHQVSPVQALPRPYPQFSILRPGAFLRPVAFIIPFVMFTKAAIFFLALAAFANAAPYPSTSHSLSIISPAYVSHSCQPGGPSHRCRYSCKGVRSIQTVLRRQTTHPPWGRPRHRSQNSERLSQYPQVNEVNEAGSEAGSEVGSETRLSSNNCFGDWNRGGWLARSRWNDWDPLGQF